jgi:TPR repeat protein
MVHSAPQRLALARMPGMAVLAVLLLANPAAAQQAQQPEKRPAPESSASDAVPSADEAYRKGKELEDKKSYVEAMRWYRMAADRGHAQAQIMIGSLYADGHGVKQDYVEALRWFHKAADQGNSLAQNNIGAFYLSGWGVAQDYPEAMRWLTKAADQGQPIALRTLGIMYFQGMGVPANQDEGLRFLRKAAANGDQDAKNALHNLGVQ